MRLLPTPHIALRLARAPLAAGARPTPGSLPAPDVHAAGEAPVVSAAYGPLLAGSRAELGRRPPDSAPVAAAALAAGREPIRGASRSRDGPIGPSAGTAPPWPVRVMRARADADNVGVFDVVNPTREDS